MISALLLTSCVTPTGPPDYSGCPPETIKIQDEDTGMYDCVTREELDEELRRVYGDRY